jgi:hypothetical protein
MPRASYLKKIRGITPNIEPKILSSCALIIENGFATAAKIPTFESENLSARGNMKPREETGHGLMTDRPIIFNGRAIAGYQRRRFDCGR